MNYTDESIRTMKGMKHIRHTIELDSIELKPVVLKKLDTIENKALDILRLLVKDHVVVACAENSEFCRNAVIPSKEILQRIGRNTLSGIPGADKEVCIRRHRKTPVNPMGVAARRRSYIPYY